MCMQDDGYNDNRRGDIGRHLDREMDKLKPSVFDFIWDALDRQRRIQILYLKRDITIKYTFCHQRINY